MTLCFGTVFIDTGTSGDAGSFTVTTSIATTNRSFRTKVTYLECSNLLKYCMQQIFLPNVSIVFVKQIFATELPTAACSTSPGCPTRYRPTTSKEASS